jgi:hypothetical protein
MWIFLHDFLEGDLKEFLFPSRLVGFDLEFVEFMAFDLKLPRDIT